MQKTDPIGTGTIELIYNANGHLVREDDKAANLSTTFLNSANGLVLQRERLQNQVGVGSHLFFYADGKRVGEIRNDPSDITHPTLAEEQQKPTGTPPDNSHLFETFKAVVSADFDQNFSPVNHGEPGPASGSYTVRDGDTLQGVAQQIWGDGSLWFLIAEANGMAGTETLRGGQVLRIPNGVTTIHNNSQTLRPYNPAEVIGNLDPTIIRPPPPVTHCGALSAVIGAVVAVVVTVYTAGNAAAGAAAGDAARQYSSAALNGRLDWGDFFREGLKLAVLGQVSPLAAGTYAWKHREHPPGFTGENTYDYESTVIAGLAGLASQGVGVVAQGAPDYVRAALQAGASAVTRNGLNFAMGRTEDFNWRGVLASSIGAAAGAGVTGYLEGEWGDVLGEAGARAGGNLAGGLLEQRLLKKAQRDYRGVFASTLGSVIGDSIVSAMTPQDPLGDFIDQKLAEQRRRDLYGPAGGIPVAGTGLGYRTSGPGIRLSEQAVADWSNDVDSGIRDAGRALANFDSAAGRVWGQEDAQAALDGRAALLRQHARADAYGRELARQADMARQEQLRAYIYAAQMSGGPRGGSGAGYDFKATAPAAVEMPQYDAMGNYTGTTTVVSAAPGSMSYVDQMSHLANALHVPQGFMKNSYDQAVNGMLDGNNSWLDRGVNLLGATAMLPLTGAEESFRGILNIPSAAAGAFPQASQAGTYAAIAMDASQPADVRIAASLAATRDTAFAFTGLAGMAAAVKPTLEIGLPPSSVAGLTIATPGTNLRAILAGAEELSPAQAAVLAQLDGFGSRVVIPKRGFGQNDLAALSAATGDEFAMFTAGGRRLIARGDASGIPIGVPEAEVLAAQGWRWSSHVHPDGVLRSSGGDRAVLGAWGNNARSAILDPVGGRSLFSPAGDMISPNWLPSR